MLNLPNSGDDAMAKLTPQEALKALGGDAESIGRELKSFSNAATVLSSSQPRLIDTHAKEWVGIYEGKVAASASDFPALLVLLAERHVPTQNTLIRFIDTEEKTLIL